MRLLLRLLFYLFLLAPLVMGTIGWLALSESSLAFGAKELTHQDIARAKQILRRYDPRHSRAGRTRHIALTEQDLNLAANYALQTYAGGGAHIDLLQNEAAVSVSARIPYFRIKPFVNLRAKVLATSPIPQITNLTVGRVPIPDLLSGWLFKQVATIALSSADIELAQDTLQSVRILGGQVLVSYRWHPRLVDAVRDNIIAMHDRDALNAYHAKLAELTARGVGSTGSLATFLPQFAALAASRSRTGQAVEENRAMLLVLGAWASGHGLRAFVPDAAVRPKRFRLTLHRRRDLARHYLISAALAVGGDSLLADAVGLFKEVSDSNRGSGFSFTDLAADRAGTRFGDLATRSEADARRLQMALASQLNDRDLMPVASDLPEHLSEAEFSRRYIAIGSPAYQLLIDEIERRLDATPLIRH